MSVDVYELIFVSNSVFLNFQEKVNYLLLSPTPKFAPSILNILYLHKNWNVPLWSFLSNGKLLRVLKHCFLGLFSMQILHPFLSTKHQMFLACFQPRAGFILLFKFIMFPALFVKQKTQSFPKQLIKISVKRTNSCF